VLAPSLSLNRIPQGSRSPQTSNLEIVLNILNINALIFKNPEKIHKLKERERERERKKGKIIILRNPESLALK